LNVNRAATSAPGLESGAEPLIGIPETWDVRRTIELRTAELAALVRTDDEASEILSLADAIAEQSDDLSEMTVRDIAFHEAVARASHNSLFVQIIASFAPMLKVAVPTAWRTRVTDGQRRIMIERHQAVAKAILRQDPVAATMAMSAHFDSAIGDMLKAARRRAALAQSA
jgi:DNA-binding FadR family transcriptional regulator